MSSKLELISAGLSQTDVSTLFPDFTSDQVSALSNTGFNASLFATREFISGNLDAGGTRGNFALEGSYSFSTDAINADAVIENLDLGGLFSDQVTYTKLTGTASIETSSIDVKQAVGSGQVIFNSGEINDAVFDSAFVSAQWENGVFTPTFYGSAFQSELNGMGTLDIREEIPSVEFSGSGRNINLKAVTQIQEMQETHADVEYELFLTGSNRNNVYGQVSLDIPFAIVGEDTLPSHQFYADFNEPGNQERSLRITSTAVDFSMIGQYDPEALIDLMPYWRSYFDARVNEEFLLSEVTSDTTIAAVGDQNLDLSMVVKNVDLIRAYFPDLPSIKSRMELISDINANTERLLFNAAVRDPGFEAGNISADSLSMQITGSFRHSEKLKDFSGLQVQAQASSLNTDFVNGKDVELDFQLNEDSVFISQRIGRIQDQTSFDFKGTIELTDTLLTGSVRQFILGNESYQWVNQGIPTVFYSPDNKLEFQEFSFKNFDEFLSFSGVFSNLPEDSVNYVIRSVNLGRISELLNGRINFSGELNGTFTTRALTRIPTIHGNLDINRLAIEENVVGDIEINSSFNSTLNRFDTGILIKTDSTKYPDYFVRNNRSGQDIELKGYVLAPEGGEFPEADSLYKFSVDFESVDLWVIPFIAPNVFSEMSGRASGSGYIWGNTETYDFNVDYQVGVDDAVFMKPRFLETNYYAQGEVSFSRSRGLDFKGVYIIDPSGGSAILSGTYDLNDFQDLDYIDLTLQMDEFQFLNSEFGPDLPFFGQAYGSSTVQLTGTNLNPVLTTVTPINLTEFTNIGIPLLEETEFDQDSKFIRFVDDFSTANRRASTAGSSNFVLDEEENPFDRTFAERFTLDMQFVANNPMTVQLIFDPVTGDIIHADGTGRLRILLRDTELTMFGQFDISGGSYNFVSGDIFTRRFELEPGGSIIWEGPPGDARLSLNAIYEARPDINTLTQARSDIDRETSQRVPVELVLNVGGSLTSIENDFYFRLPNNFETRQNTTLSTQINNLNRNEDEKLIQATSFLLMGDFIPTSTASSDATSGLSSNFSSSGAVLNPLLSSQVISPLLSSQINSLLRSDIGTLDIDFNLNTYNNVDLAVALRLYNDRIILSREGQITGAQSDIGDLGATYRINQTLSVTAFHRQDPTFRTFTSTDESQQFQDINGVGVEAEVSFNSWNEFFKKLASPFRRLFGTKDKEEEQQTAAATSQN